MLLLLDALDVDVTVPDVLDVDSLPLRAGVNGFDVEHLAVSMRQHKDIRHKAQGIRHKLGARLCDGASGHPAE